MVRWLRTTLLVILGIAGAGLWGFIATWMGAPTMVVGFGAALIGMVTIVRAFSGNSN